MDAAATHAPELFPHIRIVMGMVIGLGITRLLMWLANVVQHPKRATLYLTHMLWVASILLEMVHFWWWEFALFNISEWTFGVYFFLIAYCIALYLLAALLVPDNIDEYKGYEDFFLSRRKWFFGLFAATFLFDIVDTMIKGPQYLAAFGFEYAIQIPVGIGLSILAMFSSNRRIQLGLVIVHIVYQASWIYRLFYTVT
jgi:hypothetical protein